MKTVLIFAAGLVIGHTSGTLYGAALMKRYETPPNQEPKLFFNAEGPEVKPA